MSLLTSRRRGVGKKEEPCVATITSLKKGQFVVGNNTTKTISYSGRSTYMYAIFSLSKGIKKFKCNFGAGSGDPWVVFYGGNTYIYGYTTNPSPRSFSLSADCDKIYMSIRQENRATAYIMDNDTGEYIWKGSDEDWSKWRF